MEYMILKPAEGKTHNPTGLKPWTYPIDSERRSIYQADGKTPRPMSVEEAAHALQYFTCRGEFGEMECLVDHELRSGALETVVTGGERVPQIFACKVDGCTFESSDWEVLAEHIAECAVKQLQSKSAAENVSQTEPTGNPDFAHLDLDTLREMAKALGIPSYHNKGRERLEADIAAAQAGN